MLKKIALFLLISLGAGAVGAQESQPSESSSAAPAARDNIDAFHRGIEAYQSKDYAKAKGLFLESLADNPESIALNTDLGMTYFNLGDKARALAHLRRAHALDPSASTPVQALKYLRSQGVATDVESADGVKAFYDGMLKFAAWVPPALLFVLAPLALLWCGWTLIQYLARRRGAEEGAGISFPKSTAFAGVLWLIFAGLQVLQALHDHTVRGTVVVEKATILSAPDEKAPSLFDAAGGDDLEVLAVQGDWLQIANVRGEYGWVKGPDLLITTRKLTP